MPDLPIARWHLPVRLCPLLLTHPRWRADMSEGEARALLEDCLRVLWYRDTRALNKITLAKVSQCQPYSRRIATRPGPSHRMPTRSLLRRHHLAVT
jgi:hypothetical protein